MSAIDLSEYDFKEVLIWAFDKIQEGERFLKDSSSTECEIMGYKIPKSSVYNSIESVIQNMVKIEEKKYLKLTLIINGETIAEKPIEELAKLLKPYLKE